MKINVALDRPPNWKALPSDGKVGPQHHGTMHVCPDQDYIERAYDDAKYGRWARDPMLECTMATALDDTLAPPGKHILSMFVQYAPYHLKGTTWDVEKDKFADRCFDILEEYAPGFKSSVLHRMVIPPPDMERMWGITGGNIMQGSMNLLEHVQLPPGGGVRELPHAGEGAVHVRRRDAPRRRRDGRVRPERGAGDPAGRVRAMATPDHIRAHRHSSHHRDEVLASEFCGCFYCLALFPPGELSDGDWTDFYEGVGQTAMCPKCGLDSVIGSESGYPLTTEFPEWMKQHWFDTPAS